MDHEVKVKVRWDQNTSQKFILVRYLKNIGQNLAKSAGTYKYKPIHNNSFCKRWNMGEDETKIRHKNSF